jgi:hypothetical protein
MDELHLLVDPIAVRKGMRLFDKEPDSTVGRHGCAAELHRANHSLFAAARRG